MIVKQIELISEYSRQAVVTVTDGVYDIDCFCDHLQYNIGDLISRDLYAFSTDNIVLNLVNEYYAKRNSSDFSYVCSGKVLDNGKWIIGIGEIKIDLGMPGPKDINVGDFVSFSCERIDLV